MIRCFFLLSCFLFLLIPTCFSQESGNYYSLKSGLEQPELVRLLDLSNLGLKSLPETIMEFGNLEIIDLSGNNFSQLPEYLFRLPKLNTLWINDNPELEVVALFADLEKIQNLEKLSLANCNLRIIDTRIGKLTSLRLLDLSGNGLISLPESFRYLQNLGYLDISDNSLTSLENIPSRLQSLDISFNPDLVKKASMTKLAGMPFLGSLVIKGAIELPAEITLLSQISHLDLSAGLFRVLPDNLSGLSSLESLTFNNCTRLNWSVVIKQLTTLRKLRELNITDNNQQQLPPGFPKLKRLTKLNLSGTKYKALPFDFYKCRKLEELNFRNTTGLDLEMIVSQAALMKRVRKLSIVNSALRSLPVNLHFLRKLEIFDLRGNLLDPGLEDLLHTVLPECEILFDKPQLINDQQVVDLPEIALPYEDFFILPSEPASLKLKSGTSLHIPANSISFNEAGNNSGKIKIRIQETTDPVAVFFSGFRENGIKQITGFFEISFPDLREDEKPEFLRPFSLEWSSNDAYMHMDVFRKTHDNIWILAGSDELVLNVTRETELSDFASGTIPNIPQTPVPPQEPLSPLIGIDILERRKALIFAIRARDDEKAGAENTVSEKSFNELESLKEITWKYDGKNVDKAVELLAGISTGMDGFANDFFISPDAFEDNYRIFFQSPSGNFEIPVYPLFGGIDYSLTNPQKDQELNRTFYTKYYEHYMHRKREWEVIDSEYQHKLQAYNQDVEEFRQGMEGLASLVSPSSMDDVVATGQYRRKARLNSTGRFWIGRERQVIGQSVYLVYTDMNGRPLYPQTVFILDQSNNMVMRFEDNFVQLDPKADNTVIALLPDGGIGFSKRSALRSIPSAKVSSRQAIQLEMLEAKAVNAQRLKYIFFNK